MTIKSQNYNGKGYKSIICCLFISILAMVSFFSCEQPSSETPTETYTITYELDGGVNAETNPATYTKESDAITLVSATKTDYTFDGWYENSEFTGIKVTVISTGSTGNKTFYAKWVAAYVDYKVEHYQQNIDDDNYTLVTADTETKSGTTGADTAAAAKTYEGFTAQTITQGKVAADGSTVVKVYYDRNIITLTFNLNDGTTTTTLTDGKLTGKYCATVTVEDPTKDGWKFSGWKDASGTIATLETFATDATYTAQWKDVSKAVIHYDLNGGEGTAPVDETVPVNTQFVSEWDSAWNKTTSSISKIEKKFIGWNTSATDTIARGSFDLSDKGGETVTLYAVWVENGTKKVRIEYSGFNDKNGYYKTLLYYFDKEFEVGDTFSLDWTQEDIYKYYEKGYVLRHTPSSYTKIINNDIDTIYILFDYAPITIRFHNNGGDEITAKTSLRNSGDPEDNATWDAENKIKEYHWYKDQNIIISESKNTTESSKLFAGWYCYEDLSGPTIDTTKYDFHYKFTKDIDLYAYWYADTDSTVLFRFNGNGATSGKGPGSIVREVGKDDANHRFYPSDTIECDEPFTREGFKLTGWSKDKDAIEPDGYYTVVNNNLQLNKGNIIDWYAIWEWEDSDDQIAKLTGTWKGKLYDNNDNSLYYRIYNFNADGTWSSEIKDASGTETSSGKEWEWTVTQPGAIALTEYSKLVFKTITTQVPYYFDTDGNLHIQISSITGFVTFTKQ